MAIYENFVLENKMTDIVNTQLDVNALFTTDTSLSTAAGMKKVIHKYTYTGEVEKLAKGAKNSVFGQVDFETVEYDIERYQQAFKYNDVDVMTDPYWLDTAVEGAAVKMANHMKSQYFDELAKISNTHAADVFNYDAVVDALAAIDREVETDQFIIMGNDMKAAIRKDEDFKASRQGEILYTGQFGTICGVPCLFSKLVPANTVYVTAKDQVTLFVKKDGIVEQDRDMLADDNIVKYERFGVMALTNEQKSVKITVGA